VDIAPSPHEILEVAAASLAGIPNSELRRLSRRLTESEV
jgi:hypothetical protein